MLVVAFFTAALAKENSLRVLGPGCVFLVVFPGLGTPARPLGIAIRIAPQSMHSRVVSIGSFKTRAPQRTLQKAAIGIAARLP
jgi:hypothetical protein